MEKYDRAVQLVNEDKSNTQIIATLVEEYGSGISTTRLADMRAARFEATDPAEEMRLTKRAFCREMLLSGHSGYAIQKACKEEFGAGLGYEVIQAVQAEIEEENSKRIVAVNLPSEMMEDEAVPDPPSADLAVVPPHGPNGTLNNMKAIQQWMAGINAESMTLTRDGKLSVLARHEFDIGGLE